MLATSTYTPTRVVVLPIFLRDVVIGQPFEAFLIRRAGDATFGDDRRDVTVRRHIESRIGDVDSVRGEPDVLDVSDFTFVTLFNRDLIARRDFEVEGRDRSGDVKR